MKEPHINIRQACVITSILLQLIRDEEHNGLSRELYTVNCKCKIANRGRIH